MNNRGRLGVEICDNIGDVFHNPYFLRLIQKYHREIKGESLNIFENRKDKIFSSDFYEYIESLFRLNEEKKKFLAFGREKYLDQSERNPLSIPDLQNVDYISVLLSIEEISTQFCYHNLSSIEGIFSTRIVDIKRRASDILACCSNEGEEIGLGLMLYHSLCEIKERGIFPVGINGEILCYLKKIEKGHQVCEIGENEPFEIDLEDVRIEQKKLGTDKIPNLTIVKT